MERQVECVPNVSDGRHPDVVERLAASVGRVSGILLLDQSSDRDHDRSVLTFAGEASAVLLAARELAIETIARIDLRAQHGQHPRIGALDVVPFVPLGDTSMDICVQLACDLGAWLSRRFALPVFLYGAAARRPDRRILADIRRPSFEGLAGALSAPHGAPDFGPRDPHPTAGATVVGARPPLIAWNIQLDSADLGVARRIASAIRERSGGLPIVQALGIPLGSIGRVQVSMNLLDHTRTPMWRVFERVTELASLEGVRIIDSELIGLAPLSALLETATHAGVDAGRPLEDRVLQATRWLAIRDGAPDMALEFRLAAHRSGATLGQDA